MYLTQLISFFHLPNNCGIRTELTERFRKGCQFGFHEVLRLTEPFLIHRSEGWSQEQLNSHYAGQANELKKQHEQEKVNPPQGTSQQELNKRHQEEMKTLQEQRKKETKVLENKHKPEQQQAQGQDQKKSPDTKKQEKKKNEE